MSIEVTDVTKRFGDFVALENINLSIPTGQLTALLGPSGGGKTGGAYRFALTCSAELCAASASLAEIAAVSAAVPQLGASLPLPQARGR